ncbi:hypothetical protein GN958_ATG11092 [Phytophthora infestans]|uniref:Uncharacterized protein n=1 Tax=Phytophthora infestans TaxID=4787 RepID=A0A8S9UJF5_PHYIN|nr:hypothetical protein GN958_ATG11092 [Phytophthora infestans]
MCSPTLCWPLQTQTSGLSDTRALFGATKNRIFIGELMLSAWRIYEDESGDNMWSLRDVLRDEKLKATKFPSTSGSSFTITSSDSSGQRQRQTQHAAHASF